MSDFPVDIGPQYEGEVVRKGQYQVEFGGPDIRYKAELVTVKGLDEVEHEKIQIVGPDLAQMEEGKSYPLAIAIDIAGANLEKDTEPVLERRIHMYTNYIEGVYHMAQRDDIWMRLSKESYKKGLNSLTKLGEILIFLFTSELDMIEKISITFITDPQKVQAFVAEAVKVYEARDNRARGMKDEDVAEFYGCVLCQSFAPTHVCVITPERVANCGAISWFDGRAACNLDPEGPIFAIEKGDLLDPVKGEYAGANQVAAQRSLGEYDRVYLYSAFEHPHTSCGCFQAICFYIPEVDAFGIVHRDFIGPTVVGLPFSRMAGQTSGGKQVEGSCGLALELIRSPRFFQADGGLRRVVWMPKAVKERFKDSIPADLYDKIASEEDAKNTEELTAFLDNAGHPWVRGEVELP